MKVIAVAVIVQSHTAWVWHQRRWCISRSWNCR